MHVHLALLVNVHQHKDDKENTNELMTLITKYMYTHPDIIYVEERSETESCGESLLRVCILHSQVTPAPFESCVLFD